MAFNDIQPVIKMFERVSGRYHIFNIFQDALQMWCYALSNKFDLTNYDRREKAYLELAKKYNSAELEQIAAIFAEVFKLLSSQAYTKKFDDYLGQLYMSIGMGNINRGQFFTPYSVSKVMAEMTLFDWNFNQDVMTINEPTCGAGGMIIALTDVLYNKYKFNYTNRMFVIAQDIDILCVMMTYLQCSLAAIPAIVYHGDTLTMKMWDAWYTPAYLFQWQKFDKALRDGNKKILRPIIGPVFRFN